MTDSLIKPAPWFPLETERLILREMRASDQDDIQAYAADPEVIRYRSWGPNSPDDTRRVLAERLARQACWPRPLVELGVELKADRRMIGSIRLEIQDAANRGADFGHVYARRVWGQGIATEAARAILATGFEQLGLHRVWATCDARNLASARVLEKLGLRQEGRLRRDIEVRGFWRDTLIYAVLEEEWRAGLSSAGRRRSEGTSQAPADPPGRGRRPR